MPRAWGCSPESPKPGFLDGDDRTSQVPGGPHYERALLFDPGGTTALGHYRALVLSSAIWTASTPAISAFRGSITRPAHSLSTLRRVGCPTAAQDSLPDSWPTFPGGTDYPLGPNERFQVSFHPPFPGFAWRTQIAGKTPRQIIGKVTVVCHFCKLSGCFRRQFRTGIHRCLRERVGPSRCG